MKYALLGVLVVCCFLSLYMMIKTKDEAYWFSVLIFGGIASLAAADIFSYGSPS